MNRIALCLGSCLLLGLLQAPLPAPAQQRPQASEAEALLPNVLQPLERYNNRQLTLFKEGKPSVVHVTIRDWEVHGRQKISKFPETGTLVISLQSGRIITNIGGKEAKREPGDYWRVPAGTTMGLEVTSESATLHVLAIGRP